ncbi:hypothetical protein, partial [Ornithinibacillus halotolerans]|uniref:hypothetical protein n=1 Tax=Ornithinibacillus halotolerans TaxID=1274357 RepID=UPI001E329D59
FIRWYPFCLLGRVRILKINVALTIRNGSATFLIITGVLSQPLFIFFRNIVQHLDEICIS